MNASAAADKSLALLRLAADAGTSEAERSSAALEAARLVVEHRLAIVSEQQFQESTRAVLQRLNATPTETREPTSDELVSRAITLLVAALNRPGPRRRR